MKKKSDNDTFEDLSGSEESNEDDSFVFELFADDDEDEEEEGELDQGVEFSLGTETPDTSPDPNMASLNGAYSKTSSEDPGLVEDLAQPAVIKPSSARGPDGAADQGEGVLGRINLRTIDPREMRRQRAQEKLASMTSSVLSGEAAKKPHEPAHKPTDPPAPPVARLEEPLPNNWLADGDVESDDVDITWPWEETGEAAPEAEPAAGPPPPPPPQEVGPAPTLDAEPPALEPPDAPAPESVSVHDAPTKPRLPSLEEPEPVSVHDAPTKPVLPPLEETPVVAMPEMPDQLLQEQEQEPADTEELPPLPDLADDLPPPEQAPLTLSSDDAPDLRDSAKDMRLAVDGLVQAALDDWTEEPTDALSGFDNQPTIRISDRKLQDLGKYLERVSAQRQDVMRVLLPSQAPLPPELDEATRQKVEEARALFQNMHMVLQSIWAEGGCQVIPGGPVVLDMAMVGPAHDWLLDLLDRRGALELEISPYELLLHGRTVMSSEVARNNPFFHLYQEGARLLTIHPGLTEMEFRELFRILTFSPSPGMARDATTALWELELPHLSIASVGATPEQLLDADEDLLNEHLRLVRLFNRSLHGEQAFTDPGSSQQELDEALQDHSLRLRLELVRSLEHASGEDAYKQVRSEIKVIGADQVRRFVHAMLELMGTSSQSALYVGACIDLLQHKMVLGRWAALGVFCRTLAKAMEPEAPDKIRRSAALVQAGMGKLLDRHTLVAMEPALAVMREDQLSGLEDLVAVLPSAADAGLVMMTEHAQNDDVQGFLIELINERGINMELMLTRRLLSEDDEEVMEGIEVLRAAPTGESIDAIRSTLGHDNPDVRISALKALEEHVTDEFIPDIVDCLEIDHEKLRDTGLALLSRVRQDKVATHLIPLLESLASSWDPAQRRKALGILVRAGSNEAYGFLVKHITTRNLLRDATVEDFRKETLDALVENGGRFPRKVLSDSLNQNWTFGSTRAAIQSALNRLSRTT